MVSLSLFSLSVMLLGMYVPIDVLVSAPRTTPLQYLTAIIVVPVVSSNSENMGSSCPYFWASAHDPTACVYM
eukprot:jgi/Antlo1/503/1543